MLSFFVTVVDIGIYKTTLCLSLSPSLPLSLSLSMCLVPTLTHILHHKDVDCTSALTASSPTSGIRAFEVLQPAADHHHLAYNILDLFFLKNKEEKDTYDVAPRPVK